jgi:hypothetical protein
VQVIEREDDGCNVEAGQVFTHALWKPECIHAFQLRQWKHMLSDAESGLQKRQTRLISSLPTFLLFCLVIKCLGFGCKTSHMQLMHDAQRREKGK